MYKGLSLILLGVLSASKAILSRKPDMKQLFDRIAPVQGWVGAVAAVWGACAVISLVFSLGWLANYPMTWLVYLIRGVLLLSLGLLLGAHVLKTHINSPKAQATLDQVRAKLEPFQTPLGIAGIVVGVWWWCVH